MTPPRYSKFGKGKDKASWGAESQMPQITPNMNESAPKTLDYSKNSFHRPVYTVCFRVNGIGI